MYQLSKLKNFTSIIHGFSTVDDGNMSFKFGGENEVFENRKRFLKNLGIKPGSCVSLMGQHGDKIVVVDKNYAGRGLKDYKQALKDYKQALRVDGLITKEKGLYLFMLAADCLPIIFYSPKKEIVGIAHAGWRGADNKIAVKAVKKLEKEFGCIASDLIIAFGPAALGNSYIKGNPSQKSSSDWKPFLEKINGNKYKVDFVGFCKQQLIEVGVKKENLFESTIDTIKDSRFYSHYRDSKVESGDSGRFACVVGLKA